ncbi:hypothetical protein, partial [Mycobacterium kyorinense]|uniref:hypothetical protein n=1 Tax=Mycobacterium kyorinense TaxID=487514 RepID=UPI0005F0034A
LDTMIAILERTYDLTRQLTEATHDTTRDLQKLQAVTDKIRDNVADFDDFFRPIRSYFYLGEALFRHPDLLGVSIPL